MHAHWAIQSKSDGLTCNTAMSCTRFEEEAAKGGETLLAAARERENAVMANLNDLRDAMTFAANEFALKEDNFRCV